MSFMPGAYRANWSLPKYDWPAPAARISVSYGVTAVRPRLSEVTVFAAMSMSVTSPRIVVMLRCLRTISRVAGAISPSERMPVATW